MDPQHYPVGFGRKGMITWTCSADVGHTLYAQHLRGRGGQISLRWWLAWPTQEDPVSKTIQVTYPLPKKASFEEAHLTK